MTCYHDADFSRGNTSILAKRIVLGWYDGPTAGVGECSACGTALVFEMLAWDELQDERVFSLATLHGGSLDELVTALEPLGLPQWPEWTPKWQFASDDIQKSVEGTVQGILSQAASPEWVVLTERIGSDNGIGRRMKEVDLPMQWDSNTEPTADFEIWSRFIRTGGA